MFGANFSSTVLNKPCQQVFYEKRETYSPFGKADIEGLINTLKLQNIKIFRQLITIDECLNDDGSLRESYINEIAEISKMFKDNDLKLIISFYQNLYSRQLGGCGLPKSYLPEKHKDCIVRLTLKQNKLQLLQQSMSQQQQECWQHFFKDCTQKYIDDIVRILKYLHNILDTNFYDYIDIINSPDFEKQNQFAFLFKNNDYERQQLQNVYEKCILNIHSEVFGNKCNYQTKYIIEPLINDQVQLVKKYIGMNQLQFNGDYTLLQEKVVFGPHLYQISTNPQQMVKNFITTCKQCNFSDLIITEFADISINNNLIDYHEQIKLFQQLDLISLVWELDVSYNNGSIATYERDMYPYKDFQSSIIENKRLSNLGKLMAQYSEYQLHTRVIQSNNAEYNDLVGKVLQNRRFNENQIYYNYVMKLNKQQDVWDIRLQALKQNAQLQIVDQIYIFSDIKLNKQDRLVEWSNDGSSVTIQ